LSNNINAGWEAEGTERLSMYDRMSMVKMGDETDANNNNNNNIINNNINNASNINPNNNRNDNSNGSSSSSSSRNNNGLNNSENHHNDADDADDDSDDDEDDAEQRRQAEAEMEQEEKQAAEAMRVQLMQIKSSKHHNSTRILKEKHFFRPPLHGYGVDVDGWKTETATHSASASSLSSLHSASSSSNSGLVFAPSYSQSSLPMNRHNVTKTGLKPIIGNKSNTNNHPHGNSNNSNNIDNSISPSKSVTSRGLLGAVGEINMRVMSSNAV
jgi:hypothetical protein